MGRSDKKYCHDACRSQHFHQQHAEEREKIRAINIILRNNRRILKQYQASGGSILSRSALREQGFKFEFFTHVKDLKHGSRAYFCYDLAYVCEEEGKYRLISEELALLI